MHTSQWPLEYSHKCFMLHWKIFKGGAAGDDYSSYYGRKRRDAENYVVNWENRGKLSQIQLEDESVLAPKVSKSSFYIYTSHDLYNKGYFSFLFDQLKSYLK